MKRVFLLGIYSLIAILAFSQHSQPGFRGWVYSSIPPALMPQNVVGPELNMNRANLSWYVIDPVFYYGGNNRKVPLDALSEHDSRQVRPSEIWRYRTNITGDNLLVTLNIHYQPSKRGPYNYDVLPGAFSAGMDSTGALLAPETRWAGMMRNFVNPNLPSQGMDSIEFWLMDPFSDSPDHEGFTMTFQLGDISEDIIHDGEKYFENWLSGEGMPTDWGLVPEVENCSKLFSDSEFDYDVGLDGLNDAAERAWFGSLFLDPILNTFGANSEAFQNAWTDPSADNFTYYDSPELEGATITERYLAINGMEGNSASIPESSGYINGYSLRPDGEDLNGNCTLDSNDVTEDYVLRLEPGMPSVQDFIIDSVWSEVRLANGQVDTANWYHFRFPLVKVGSQLTLDDFRDIPSLRILFSDCKEEVMLRIVASDIFRMPVQPYGPELERDKPEAFTFPNPFVDSFDFRFEEEDEWPHRLELYDTAGRLVDVYENFACESKYYADERLRPGMYIYHLRSVKSISGGTGNEYIGKVVKVR